MDLLFGSFLFAVILTLITMVFLVKQSEAVLLYCATAVMFDIFDTLPGSQDCALSKHQKIVLIS